MKQALKSLEHDPKRADAAATMLRAIAHPLRLRIIATLCSGEEHVSGLAERLDNKPAIISQQLRILRAQRLVEVARDNGFAYYQLAEPKLRELVTCIENCKTS